MTITIREQVLAALRNNPGLNNAKLAGLIGMDTKKISGTISTLLADGLISCEGKYGQRLYSLTSYGMRFAPDTIIEKAIRDNDIHLTRGAHGRRQASVAALDSALRDSGTGYSGEMEVSAEQAKGREDSEDTPTVNETIVTEKSGSKKK